MKEAITALSGKADWETPKSTIKWIEQETGIKPKIDLCATKHNRKYPKYITPEKDLFKTEVNDDFFCNPPYVKGLVDRFVEYCYRQSFLNRVDGVCLIFANTCSTKYWRKYIGNTPHDRNLRNCELYFLPERVKFEVNHKPVGTPPFASVAVVWRHRYGSALQ
jgi:hypothetical protein